MNHTTTPTAGMIGTIVMLETLIPVLRRLWSVPPYGGNGLLEGESDSELNGDSDEPFNRR